MSEPEQSIIRELGFWLTGIAGGLVDYFNQVNRNERKWSIFGLIVHLSSAVFFCFIVGKIALGLHYSPEIALGVGGLGGFFGTRVADLATAWVGKRAG